MNYFLLSWRKYFNFWFVCLILFGIMILLQIIFIEKSWINWVVIIIQIGLFTWNLFKAKPLKINLENQVKKELLNNLKEK